MKFSNELYHNLTRKHAWEAVFRIRLSQGFTQLESYGNIQIKQRTNDLILAPTIDSDRTFTYEFDKVTLDTSKDSTGKLSRLSQRFLFVQSALLYSTSDGERRIRCHSVAIPYSQNIGDSFDYIDINSMSFFLYRKALARIVK